MKTGTINQPFSITPSDAGLICSKATYHTNHCFYCFMPFTSFCLFLSLSLSHFSLLLSFSLDFFFFLVLFNDSIHANFSVECPGTNTGASPRACTQISLPLCGDLFSFFSKFSACIHVAFALKWHGKRDISQSSLKCSSVHCCMKKNCCVWFGAAWKIWPVKHFSPEFWGAIAILPQ